MKMKKKALISSLLTIALCFSLIAGSTFALFTSTSQTDIAATSATVDVKAVIDEASLVLKSMEEGQLDVAQPAHTFKTGGTAAFDTNSKLTLTNMVPGDSVEFNINVTNNSNVDVKYRVKWSIAGELAGALVGTADGVRIGNSIAAWQNWPEADANTKTIPVVVDLPEEVGNEYQNKTASITFIVEAIQGNAEVFDDTNAEVNVGTSYDETTGVTETIEDVVAEANGFTAEIPAGTTLTNGATTTTLVVTEDVANTGNFDVTATGAEAVGLNISIPEVAPDNEKPITITLTGILDAGLSGVMLYHKDVPMVAVESAADVRADGEFYYDAATGDITLATKNFSNFTVVVLNSVEVATGDELVEAINAGKSVILTADVTLTKTLLIKKDTIIDLNGFALNGNVTSGALLQTQSNAKPALVVTSTKSGATINAGNASVILGYGSTEFYNVAINVARATSAPFNVYGDLTIGAGVVTQIDFLGTSLISNNGKVAIAINDAKFNISEFKVNAGYMVSLNSATTVAIDGAEFNVKVNASYPTYFCNKPANVTVANTAFNVTDTEAEYAYALNENSKWVSVGKIVRTQAELADAIAAAGADTLTLALVADLALDADTTITVGAGKNVVLNLNGYTIYAESDATGSNRNIFDARGTFTVMNGTIDYKHVGANMGWGSSTNVFNVTAGGVLNIVDATIRNLGGSDMAFCVHLNNWGEVTLNAENSVFESTYVAIRAFNSGYDMNNVTLKGCTVKGASAALWVHNYTVADFGTEAKANSQQALLNFDIDESNTLVGNSEKAGPVRYGFTNAVYCAAEAGLPAIG